MGWELVLTSPSNGSFDLECRTDWAPEPPVHLDAKITTSRSHVLNQRLDPHHDAVSAFACCAQCLRGSALHSTPPRTSRVRVLGADCDDAAMEDKGGWFKHSRAEVSTFVGWSSACMSGGLILLGNLILNIKFPNSINPTCKHSTTLQISRPQLDCA